MARRHKPNTPPAKKRFPGAEIHKTKTPPATKQRFSGAERSALFARREAANVLRSVLRGDAERRAVASIKSLVFSPSVRNKRATFALVCETLKRMLTSSSSIIIVPKFRLNILKIDFEIKVV